jgi:hypothetical protein
MEIFPDILRAIITDIMLVLLLCTMAMPKYKSKWVYIFATLAILVGNLIANCYFYLQRNYTSVFLVDLKLHKNLHEFLRKGA